MQHHWICLPLLQQLCARQSELFSLVIHSLSGTCCHLPECASWALVLDQSLDLSLQPICNSCHHLSVAPVAFLKLLIWLGHYTAPRWASERKGWVQPECYECRLHFYSFEEQFSTSNCHWMVPTASPAAICLLLLDAAWELNSRHCTWLSKLECVTLRDMSSLVVRWGR